MENLHFTGYRYRVDEIETREKKNALCLRGIKFSRQNFFWKRRESGQNSRKNLSLGGKKVS